jgi:predicted alpha/beta-hydrolase family hydrolase
MSAESCQWHVAADGDRTTAVWEAAISSPRRGAFVCAHGAGGHMSDGAMLRVSATLRGRGLDVVRFNFFYREKGSARPDPMPRLTACMAAVASRAREALDPQVLIIGGRSMGGRAASVLAAGGFACDGLLLLAYPLHPSGQPEQLRDAHLSAVRVPVLCFNGTRDALCRRDLMAGVQTRLGRNWTMHWLQGADHGFHVLKSSGTTDADVLTEVGEVTSAWLSDLKQLTARAG